ncbi:hypothetical protein D7X33_14950 [Butyricicoccus sp. 1XD8-22]|nr:hypothetical protein D7X33_14950 [Butyricicoccus sp. 1XD8-22]
MDTKSKKITTYDIVAVGMMAAFVFIACRFFGVKIPTPGGSTTVKLGNGICVLCGLLLGGWRGGLAAAIGTAFYDLSDPEFAPDAWITFIRYFIMAGLAGTIAHWGGAKGRKLPRNVIAAVVGAYSYSAMYIASKVIGSMLLGSAFVPAVIANTTRIVASLTNATVGIAVALALAPALQRAFATTTFGRRFQTQ